MPLKVNVTKVADAICCYYKLVFSTYHFKDVNNINTYYEWHFFSLFFHLFIHISYALNCLKRLLILKMLLCNRKDSSKGTDLGNKAIKILGMTFSSNKYNKRMQINQNPFYHKNWIKILATVKYYSWRINSFLEKPSIIKNSFQALIAPIPSHLNKTL